MIALYSVPGELWIPLILKLHTPLDLLVQSGRARKIATSNMRAAPLKDLNKLSILILNKIKYGKTFLLCRSFFTVLPNFSARKLYDYRLKRERFSENLEYTAFIQKQRSGWGLQHSKAKYFHPFYKLIGSEVYPKLTAIFQASNLVQKLKK